MRVIWKFPLELTGDPIEVAMPEGGQIIHLAMQDGVPCLWALVDPEATPKLRRFQLVGTGLAPRDSWAYIDTLLLQGTALVLHLFEAHP